MSILNNATCEKIKKAASLYAAEIKEINHYLVQEQDTNKREKLLLLRTIATIEHGNAIGLYNDQMDDDYMDELTVKNMAYCAELDTSELFGDIMILTEDTKEKLFANPTGERERLIRELKI